MTHFLDILDELDWLTDEVKCLSLIIKDRSYLEYTTPHHQVMFHIMDEHINRIKEMVRKLDKEQKK